MGPAFLHGTRELFLCRPLHDYRHGAARRLQPLRIQQQVGYIPVRFHSMETFRRKLVPAERMGERPENPYWLRCNRQSELREQLRISGDL